MLPGHEYEHLFGRFALAVRGYLYFRNIVATNSLAYAFETTLHIVLALSEILLKFSQAGGKASIGVG
jgi:hypothetical protein